MDIVLRKLVVTFIGFASACSMLLNELSIANVRDESADSVEAHLRLSGLPCDFRRGNVYRLTSQPTPFRQAWLVCLDNYGKAGWLYAPPFVLNLSRLAAPPAMLRFRSEDLPDHSYYTLSVRTPGHKLEGSLTFHFAPPTSDTRDYAIHGARVGETTTTVDRRIVGRYSNTEYVEEAGDLVGSELLFFVVDRHLSGLIVFYEGYWGEPVFVPIPLLEVRAESSSAIKFEIQLEANIAQYTATLSKGSLILSRTDVPSAPEASEVRLEKQRYFLSHRNHQGRAGKTSLGLPRWNHWAGGQQNCGTVAALKARWVPHPCGLCKGAVVDFSFSAAGPFLLPSSLFCSGGWPRGGNRVPHPLRLVHKGCGF